ncbi:MAG: hypothetical protein M1823_001566 [Watsoniomyces obsoletus]|nr:MAG: hypothetical protein M1823_001566 [Watsoniomyces obsoletus]
MKLRLRGPASTAIVTLDDEGTVADLHRLIVDKIGLPHYEVRYGFPPKVLPLFEGDANKPLSSLNVRLNGEQLIVEAVEKDELDHKEPEKSPEPSNNERQSSSPSQGLISLNRAKKPMWGTDEAPQIPIPTYGATLVLRIMPDDNSCLFRAVGAGVTGTVDSMIELRALIALSIQMEPDIYTAVVLEQSPDEYCKWIQTEYSWGGAIEMNILSQHFEVEICSIDVQTLRVDRFNEGRPKRIIVVYSGVHYDAIAMAPSEPPHTVADLSPKYDEYCFNSEETIILDKAVELCRVLQSQHYYTDTAKFKIKCGVCGIRLEGESSAREHAAETGHQDFQEG